MFNLFLFDVCFCLKVKFMVEVSFFEIYNEKIHDLLADTNEKDQKKATVSVLHHSYKKIKWNLHDIF